MTGLFTYRNFSLRDTPALDGKVAVVTVSSFPVFPFYAKSSTLTWTYREDKQVLEKASGNRLERDVISRL
jgi:hypothetical protein